MADDIVLDATQIARLAGVTRRTCGCSGRPDEEAGPDLLALFVEARENLGGVDYATSSAAGTMPAANWRAFTRTVEIAGDSPRSPGKRVVSSGGGRNAKWCVTRVADLLDHTGLLENLSGSMRRLTSARPGCEPTSPPGTARRTRSRPGGAATSGQ